MPEKQVEGSIRRLAAVWFADIVGYTRMSASDEDTALALVSILQEVARAEVAAQGGRIVKFIGDAVLAEFQSTEASVRAALALNDQYEAASLNAGHPSKLRIGVHVGDVLGTPDGDLYGDGINTASRLQGAAEPGHVWVTKDVSSQMHARRDFRFTPVGEKSLKGLDAKLTVFRVTMESKEPAAAAKTAPVVPRSARYARLVRVALVYLVIAGVLVVGTGVLRNYLQLAEWVMPGGVLILLIGLVVTLATEWVQSRPPVPGSGARFPALTWGRALLGGVLAYTVLFVTAGVYQIATGGSLTGGPQPASAVSSPPDGQPDLTADAPVTQDAPETAAAAAPEPAAPSGSAADATADAPRTAYESARGTAEAARRAAQTAGASASMSVFARADSLRSRAGAEAQQGRLDEARLTIDQAKGLYDRARNDAVLENRIDSLLTALEPLQSAARLSASDAAEVQELRRQAGEAQRVARYPEAILLLQQVAGVYREAAATQGRAGAPSAQPSAPANDVRPPAPPPPTPTIAAGPVRASNEEIAAEVVEAMRSAIERKDLEALQAVWNLSETQRRGFQASWAIMRDLRVSTTTQSVQASGDQITVRINTVYQFTNESTRRSDRQESPQTLTLAQQNGRWIIVSSGR